VPRLEYGAAREAVSVLRRALAPQLATDVGTPPDPVKGTRLHKRTELLVGVTASEEFTAEVDRAAQIALWWLVHASRDAHAAYGIKRAN
jgi:hypothetical protein